MNLSWLLTSAAILVSLVGQAAFLGMTCRTYLGVVAPLFVTLWLGLTFITFFIERKFKSEFIMLRENERL
jgi:heme/copper-type cytochrome/quinol oxidase subunit 3